MEIRNNEGSVDKEKIHCTLPVETLNHKTQNWCATGSILGCKIGYPFQNDTLLIQLCFRRSFWY